MIFFSKVIYKSIYNHHGNHKQTKEFISGNKQNMGVVIQYIETLAKNCLQVQVTVTIFNTVIFSIWNRTYSKEKILNQCIFIRLPCTLHYMK